MKGGDSGVRRSPGPCLIAENQPRFRTHERAYRRQRHRLHRQPGIGHQKFTDGLLGGRTAIAPITAFDTSQCRSHRAAMLSDFRAEAFLDRQDPPRGSHRPAHAFPCRMALDDAG